MPDSVATVQPNVEVVPPSLDEAAATAAGTDVGVEAAAQPSPDGASSAAPDAAAPAAADDPVRAAVGVERARRKLREERAALERERSQLHADIEAGKAAIATIEKARKNPLDALAAGGHDFSAATQAAIERAKSEKPHEVARAAADEAQRLVAAARAEREAAKLETRIAQSVAEISQTAATDPRFEYTRVWRWTDRDGQYISGPAMAEAVIRAHYEKTGTEMPIEEALERVERHIEQEEVPRLLAVKKLADKFRASPTKKAPSVTSGASAPSLDDRFTNGAVASDADLDRIADLVARGAI